LPLTIGRLSRFNLIVLFFVSGHVDVDVDVDVVELRAQADSSMPASNNNVKFTLYTLISNCYVNYDFRFREVLLGSHKLYLDVAKIYQVAI